MRIRPFFVWLHRWVGLLMAAFLIVVGLTGSVLAFYWDLERFVSPQLYVARPSPDARELDLGTLASRAEAQEPRVWVNYITKFDGMVLVEPNPRSDPKTGRPYEVDFNQMFLSPWTGKELVHRRWDDLSQGRINLMPFVYDLHDSLATRVGTWILGVVALAWTLDCLYAIYLTFPVVLSRFCSRWKVAWKIKWASSAPRLNFDLHRASGLWLSPLLFIFAWSSVMFNLPSAYNGATAVLFDLPGAEAAKMLHPVHQQAHPRLGWDEAYQRLLEVARTEAARRSNVLRAPSALLYDPQQGLYSLVIDSNLSVSKNSSQVGFTVSIDGDTGLLQSVTQPTGEHSGVTVSTWLFALHVGNVHGWLAYRILVCVLGLVITVLSITGVYIWWKKRRARLHHRSRLRYERAQPVATETSVEVG